VTVDMLDAPARQRVQIDVDRAALSALAGVLLLVSVLFVVHRVDQPSDGSDVGGPGVAYGDAGVSVVPHRGAAGAAPFLPGDQVTAIEGRTVEEWTEALVDPGALRPSLAAGDVLTYTVVRGDRTVELPVVLGALDLTAPLRAEWGVIGFALSMQLLGLYLFIRRPAEAAARALLVAGTGMFASTIPWALGLQAAALVEGTGFWLYAAGAGLAYSLFWSGALHFALVFPRAMPFATSRARVVTLAYAIPLGAQLGLILAAAVTSGRALPALQAWMVGQLLLQVTVIVAAFGLMAYSYWRLVDPVGRAQIRWIGAAVLLVTVSSLTLWFGPEIVIGEPLLPRSAVALLGLPFPVALGVAISRHHLFRLGNLVNRSAVYAGLTAGIVIAYAGTVVLVSGLIPSDATFATTLLGVGAVALVALPLRDRLQRTVDRLMYGDRADPYRAVRRLGQRLEGTLDPRTVLPTLVETVAESLRLPYVAIELEREGEVVGTAATGTRPIGGIGSPELEHLPIAYRGNIVGRLILGHREPGERFSREDVQLLADLARQAAPAVEAVRLAADLQRSREQLVTAREEERRRLRRDLHDGFGPTLAASLMKLQAARAVADREPARSQELLDELELETRRAIEDVRRIAYDLRPPALDELGLLGALRHHAASLSIAPDAPRIDVAVERPEILAGLPAAVEVAGLRIALEALTNVVRHSGADRARVHLALDRRELIIEVADNGRGMPEAGAPGIGLTSMRERAEELGGSLQVEPRGGGGTRIVARLPIAAADAS